MFVKSILPIRSFTDHCVRCCQTRNYKQLVVNLNNLGLRFLASVRLGQQTVPDKVNPELVNRVAERLKCSPNAVQSLFLKVPKLDRAPVNSLDETINILCETGVDFSQIRENPWLLLYSPLVMRQRLRLLANIGITSQTLPLLRLKGGLLIRIVSQWQKDLQSLQETSGTHFDSRLHFFAHHLHCDVRELSVAMDKHYPLLTLNFQKLSRITFLLLEHGVSPDDIRKDLWIYRHNEDLIRQRLQMAKIAGVTHIKTWMLRCPENIFENTLVKTHNAKDVLGTHKDHISYLAERLKCTQEYVTALSKRYPRLLSINLPKIKQVLDFLYANSFTPEHVCAAPRVLSHSIRTLQNRLEELHNLKFQPKNLHLLCSTTKEFQRLIEKIQKSNKT